MFLGAPGSGKGTQAKRLVENKGSVHVSTGDLLRHAVKTATATGLEAKAYMDRGELVPDAVILRLLQQHLATLPQGASVLLDGFPRTLPQAEALDKVFDGAVETAVFFDVPEATLIRRLVGRRVCEKCGTSFHVDHVPPKKDGVCDRCGGKLLQRSDDGESVVRKRLEVFARENVRLLDYYKKNQRLRTVDATKNPDSVYGLVEGLLQ